MAPQRRSTAAAWWVLLLVVIVVAACAPQAQGGARRCDAASAPSIPPGYDEDGCWAPPEYFEAPPEVIPSVESSSPTIRVEATGTAPSGLEGTLFFIRATSPTARVVLERQWDWPNLEQQIPAGAYQVTVYSRICDGNCGYLDPTMMSCTVDVVAAPSMNYTITWEVNDSGGRPSCNVDG